MRNTSGTLARANLAAVVRTLIAGAPVGPVILLDWFGILYRQAVPGLAWGSELSGWGWLPDHNAFLQWLSNEYAVPHPPQGDRAAMDIGATSLWVGRVVESVAVRRAVMEMTAEDEP